MPEKKRRTSRKTPANPPPTLTDSDSKEARDESRALLMHQKHQASERLTRACEAINSAATPGVVGALPDDLRAALELEASCAAANLKELYGEAANLLQTQADVGGAP